ncbi:MAG: hypothetical protein QME60_03740 [Verrucomicrobiota bacterium]|nr:hypothetical protein [Verrucomicrobiota bacterium]
MSPDSQADHSPSWPHDELARRLLAKGRVSREVMDESIAAGLESCGSLAQNLAAGGQIPPREVYEELAGIHGVLFVDLKTYLWDPSAVSLITEAVARELNVFPLFTIGDALTVAVADPGDITVTDRLEVGHAARDRDLPGVPHGHP